MRGLKSSKKVSHEKDWKEYLSHYLQKIMELKLHCSIWYVLSTTHPQSNHHRTQITAACTTMVIEYHTWHWLIGHRTNHTCTFHLDPTTPTVPVNKIKQNKVNDCQPPESYSFIQWKKQTSPELNYWSKKKVKDCRTWTQVNHRHRYLIGWKIQNLLFTAPKSTYYKNI